MTTRDQYVQGLKKQLDVWNADLDRWATKAREAQTEVQERYRCELDILEAQRKLARYNLRLLEGATNDAWAELRVGAEDAWDRMRLAAAAATTSFDPLPAAQIKKAKPAPRKQA
jgi:hypothetical protein